MDIDLMLVSVDDHVVEPLRWFDGRLVGSGVDLAPRSVTRDDTKACVCQARGSGHEVAIRGVNAETSAIIATARSTSPR